MNNDQKQVVERPTGIKIISIFYYICSAGILVALIIFPFIVVGNADAEYNLLFVSFIILTLGLILLFTFFFTGRWLWKGEAPGRTMGIVFSIIFIIVNIIIMIILLKLNNFVIVGDSYENIANILDIFDIKKFITKSTIAICINLFIIGYLLLTDKVKRYFKK